MSTDRGHTKGIRLYKVFLHRYYIHNYKQNKQKNTIATQNKITIDAIKLVRDFVQLNLWYLVDGTLVVNGLLYFVFCLCFPPKDLSLVFT